MVKKTKKNQLHGGADIASVIGQSLSGLSGLGFRKRSKKKKNANNVNASNTANTANPSLPKNSRFKQTLKTGYNKVKKSSIINTKTAANKCNLSSILLGSFKCKSDTGLFKNECKKKNILKRIKNHLMFKNESDKIYIKKYFEIYLNKYINSKQKITDVSAILECMNYKMTNIFMTFYKINNFEFDKESSNYEAWVNTKSSDQNNINKSDKQILLEKFADFIVNVLIKSFLAYNSKDLEIENEFKLFLKSFSSNLYYSYNQLLGQNNSQLQKRLNNFKSELVRTFVNKNTETKLDFFYKDYQDKKETHTQQILSTLFDKNKSSKFLFTISGMFLFALLLKFDVFAAPPGMKSGTF